MPLLRLELQAALDCLDDRLGDLAQDYPDEGDFWCAFAGESDVIEDSVRSTDEAREVRRRIDAMVKRVGIAWV